MGSPLGGIKSVLEMLRTMDQQGQEKLLSQLEVQDPELVRKLKEQMFGFEDLINLTGKHMQILLANVGNQDLALAQRLASDELKDHIFTQMSSRALDMLKDLPEFQNPQRKAQVLEAQQKIIQLAQKLAVEGKISLSTVHDSDPLV